MKINHWNRFCSIHLTKIKKMNANLNTSTNQNNSLEYGELLQKPEWLLKRDLIIKRDGHRCLNCGSTNNLQVHHRQYHKFSSTKYFKRPCDYKDKYLVTLCLDCHQTGHKYFKIPVFNV